MLENKIDEKPKKRVKKATEEAKKEDTVMARIEKLEKKSKSKKATADEEVEEDDKIENLKASLRVLQKKYNLDDAEVERLT